MEIDTRLDVSVLIQRGVLTKTQAVYFGFSEDAIRHRLERGDWRELWPAVYQMAPFPTSFEQLCVAATLWSCGYASHRTAAFLHRLDGFDQLPEGPLHVTTQMCAFQQRQEGVVLHRSRALSWRDITIVSDISATTPVRTLIDVAPEASWKSLVMAYEDVVRRGGWARLNERLSFLAKGRRGMNPLKALVHRRGANPVPTESACEAICDDLLLRHGLVATRQLAVRYWGRAARIDLAFPEVGLAIECDSRKWHERRYEEDRERDNWLAFNGWHTVRFTWQMLNRPTQVVAQVRQIIEQRRHVPRPLLLKG